MRVLVERGAGVDVPDGDGWTPLVEAVIYSAEIKGAESVGREAVASTPWGGRASTAGAGTPTPRDPLARQHRGVSSSTPHCGRASTPRGGHVDAAGPTRRRGDAAG